MAIDGVDTKTTDNVYSLLAGKAGVLTELTVSKSASGANPRNIVIEPIDDESMLYHHEWVENNIRKVEEATNGGGNISPMIIERLLRNPYRMTMSRTSPKTNTVPDAAVAGLKVLLVNKYSASDDDLFSWSFKANKIGPVIGTRTWGGIIGISGSLPYMDGTDVRVPFFTNHDAATGQWIVENHGVDPDEEILKLLKDRKPLPGVLAPRTLKDLGVEE